MLKTAKRSTSPQNPPAALCLESAAVSLIGPANDANPMSQVRSKLFGSIVFHTNVQWTRITLQLTGITKLNITVPGQHDEVGQPNTVTSSTTICDVEKELIPTGESTIAFGLHLPHNLPPSIETKHASVTYTLIATLTGGPYKKHKIQKNVVVKRHYLPNSSVMIPTTSVAKVQGWFEYNIEAPRACAIEAGEVVLAARWSVEKERMDVRTVDLQLEEIESYRYRTRDSVHRIPPVIRRFPASTYHPPTFSQDINETQLIRAPIPPGLRGRHYSNYVEITHRCRITFHFGSPDSRMPYVEPLIVEVPIIITDFPDGEDTAAAIGSGDDGVQIDLDLPEYTPQYESAVQVSVSQ
ncbi:hypothetical protein BGW37DRAFT_483951 [Umbelopsis sp. PMI_123]|nr:hypothetical protein BGW37DRAFT_483951 [Umbelopsis sp. PMI_123]